MGFLAKIRNYIKRYRNRDFRTSIAREKTEKYLFRDEKKWQRKPVFAFFRKKTERLSPFSRFIQNKITTLHDITSRQWLYLGYIGSFLILASLYIVFYSPYFHISPSKVIIEGWNEAIDITLAYRSVEEIYGESIVFLDEEALAQSLKQNQKNIKEIQIDRLYPNGIKILLLSYPVIFDTTVFSLENRIWGMTENGILIPRNAFEKNGKYRLVLVGETFTEENFLDYKESISESKTKVIVKILDFLITTYKDLTITRVLYFDKENEIHIETSYWFILLSFQDFDSSRENESAKYIKSELLTLKTYLDVRKEGEKIPAPVYLDARIPGKIFSCSDTVICKSNLRNLYGEIYK